MVPNFLGHPVGLVSVVSYNLYVKPQEMEMTDADAGGLQTLIVAYLEIQKGRGEAGVHFRCTFSKVFKI